MKSKENAKIAKGMIFAGCSFTWGQGLYYYSNLETIQEPPPDQYNPDFVRDAHLEYMASVRYPRLVARHFGSYEFVHPRNGGSNEFAVDFWKCCFAAKQQGERTRWHDPVRRLDYSEISHVVFQLTQWQRDNFEIEVDGRKYDLPFHAAGSEQHRDVFLKWLDTNKLSIGAFTESYIQKCLDNVKSFLQDCESRGIKTLIFTWPGDYLRFIDKDPWLKERLVEFNYNGTQYRSIEDLMYPGTMQNKGYNPELTVKWDEDSFAGTPKDHHPSLKCHQVMAENIIRRIEGLGQ